MDLKPSLKDILVEDLPPSFLRILCERMPRVYEEAHRRVTSDPMVRKPQGHDLEGHIRRALAESLFYEVAIDSGLRAEDRKNSQQSSNYVSAEVGRLWLTIAHTRSPTTLPQRAKYREQFADINQHATQQVLFPTSFSPGNAALYAIILHSGSIGSPGELGSFVIAFPSPGCTKLMDVFELLEIRDLQSKRYAKSEDLQARVQAQVAPTWKRPAANDTDQEV